MSLAGKILAIVNILAVVAAVALLGMDYSKRRAWQYAVFREDLMINGLPLDEQESDEKGRPLVDNLSEQTAKELFPSNPVTTQRKEVERVQGQLRSKIDDAADKKQKCYLLARVLTPFAVTNDQRQRMMACRTYLRDQASYEKLQTLLTAVDRQAKQLQKESKRAQPKPYEEAFDEALDEQHALPTGTLGDEFRNTMKAKPAAKPEEALNQAVDVQLTQLQGEFEQLFRDALERSPTADSGQGRARSPLKDTIARLLFNTVDALSDEAPKLDLIDNPAYKRFILVVGVPAAAKVVNDRATALDAIAAQVRKEREDRRLRFAHEHSKAIQLVRDMRKEVEEHKLQQKRQQERLTAHEETLKKRRRDVELYDEELAAARKETDTQLTQLRKMSAALFQQRLKLRDATGKNLELEKQIRSLEEAR